ncbi:MAG: hypothetical protein HRT37_03685 [Alteromonadaceae bacterium]|nr:hypothetical protein [Alteromonadaceae bacterium]
MPSGESTGIKKSCSDNVSKVMLPSVLRLGGTVNCGWVAPLIFTVNFRVGGTVNSSLIGQNLINMMNFNVAQAIRQIRNYIPFSYSQPAKTVHPVHRRGASTSPPSLRRQEGGSCSPENGYVNLDVFWQ